jgi:predicted nucleic-acid-binding protein
MELADMTQDEILQTLRKVIKESEHYTTWTVSTPHLVELVERAVEAEREACAKVVDHILKEGGGTWGDAIRARGQA